MKWGIGYSTDRAHWLSSRNFLQGGGEGEAKSIVMQIYFVMLIFLLFWTKFQKGAKVSERRGAPCGRKPGPLFVRI